MMMYKDFLIGNSYMSSNSFGILLIPLMIWALVWKGMALWKSAQKGDKVWFVVLLVVNTLGILDILYIYLFSKGTAKKGRK
ncbi:MAG: DUF5652 family protein [Microgenomates group bacterium]